ncbi:MAG: hypothetical protein INR71_05220 [Terriglobus roseus]|nr:hypothetical protein [Terriglobus roseus]
MHLLEWQVLLGLQAFQVAFLLLHDWVPVPPLNDVVAQRKTDSLSKRLIVTLGSALPFAVLLWATYGFMQHGREPGRLLVWLWIGYGILFLGELNAWWIPYVVRPDLERSARYADLFGKTHGFLPARNGIRPNTLHVLLHSTTLLTLAVLGGVTAQLWLR